MGVGAPRGAVEGTKPGKLFLTSDENSSSGLGFVLLLGSFQNNTLLTRTIQSDFAWCLTRPKDRLTQSQNPLFNFFPQNTQIPSFEVKYARHEEEVPPTPGSLPDLLRLKQTGFPIGQETVQEGFLSSRSCQLWEKTNHLNQLKRKYQIDISLLFYRDTRLCTLCTQQVLRL